MSFDELHWKSSKLTNRTAPHTWQYGPSQQTLDLTNMLVIAGILEEWDRTSKPTISFTPNGYFLLLASIV